MVDLFHILENFISQTLRSSRPDLTKAQLYRTVLALERYLQLEPPEKVTDKDELAHLHKRAKFVKQAEKEKWVAKLKEKVSSMTW